MILAKENTIQIEGTGSQLLTELSAITEALRKSLSEDFPEDSGFVEEQILSAVNVGISQGKVRTNPIKEKRTRVGMSRAELSRRTGVSDFLIKKAESDINSVNLLTMVRLCNVLEINLSDISQSA